MTQIRQTKPRLTDDPNWTGWRDFHAMKPELKYVPDHEDEVTRFCLRLLESLRDRKSNTPVTLTETGQVMLKTAKSRAELCEIAHEIEARLSRLSPLTAVKAAE